MRQPEISSAPADVVYTVSELTRKIKRLLESQWSGVWVEGELSNVRPHPSGHLYFTIKDEGAALRGVMFRSDVRRLRFRPEDGQKIRLYGGLTIYEPQGNWQIVAQKMDPAGLGELELAFRQTFERLEKEGLFDEAHKVSLPAHPQVVGIVTSESGAAIRDIVSVLGRRAPHVRLVLRAARVQGEGAARDVANGIAELDRWGGADVLIVGRGGGSLEDLWAFNEEVVARAIRACETPIVSAVGHEVDRTIADFVADRRAATPSAAAEIVAPERRELLAGLRSLAASAEAAIRRHLRRRGERVILLRDSPAFRGPQAYVQRRAQDLDRARERLEAAAGRALERRRLMTRAAAGRLHALSPLAILGRGYAIVRTPAGEVVRRAREVSPGAAVEVWVGEGQLDCRVERVREPGTGTAKERAAR
ncbi:MAG: exodeoxyribonuclease VII large subunit [bacterium]